MPLPKKLFTDCNLIDQPANTHRDARNIVYTKLYGAIQNEPGFEQIATSYPSATAIPIGVCFFPDNSFVVFSDGRNGGQDRIGVVDVNGNYTDLIIDNTLGFDINYPIRASEIDYNYLNQRLISWTDNNNKPRILNIDNLPFSLTIGKALVTPSQIVELDLFTTFLCPNITFSSLGIGFVVAGNYSFAIAYENNDGTRTPYSPFQGNVNVTNYNSATPINQFEGVTPGTITSNSINLTINNIDTRYDRLVLIGISRQNGITTANEIKKIQTSSASLISGVYILNVTYIGTETLVPITLDEALTPYPLYNKAGCMTQLNNVLYMGNVQTYPDIDLQSVANNIRIFYNTKLVDIYDITNSHKNNAPVGFAHGGVYAFYVRGILGNGSFTRSFHIPGRPTYNTENTTSSLAAAEGLTAQRYQVEDTTNQGGHIYGSADSSGVIHVTSKSVNSNMGFWQNQNEQYPNNFTGIAGQQVRHHVFPTIRECQTKHYSSETLYGSRKLDILGIDIAGVAMPTNFPQLVGYQILYAKRDYINSNTYGTDIVLYSGNYYNGSTLDTASNWSPGGNWITATAGSSPYLTATTSNIRSHSFELLKDKPQLGGNNIYMNIELKMRKQSLGTVLTYNSFPNNGASNSGNLVISGEGNLGSITNAGALIDYTSTNNIVNTPISSQLIKALSGFRYLPSGIIDSDIYTIKNEESLNFKVNNPTISPSISFSQYNSGNSQYPFISPNDFEETYLVTYNQIKSNVYANYDQQTTIATDIIIPYIGGFASSYNNIYGGDTFIGLRSLITTAPFGNLLDVNTNIGASTIRAHITESRYNIGLRYENLGDVSTYYYPKTNPFDFWTNPTSPNTAGVTMIFNITGNPNGLAYSSDSNAVDDLNQVTIANPFQILTNTFPFRVIRSGFAATNPQEIRAWKTYLNNDNYEINRNKGIIVNLAAMDDVLLIHHSHALFRTTGKDKLSLGATEIYLGTADIFEQQPKEQIPAKLGFLGTQNIFSCISFKGGYAWCNQQEGVAYLITSNSFDEISEQGQKLFFYYNLKIDNTLPDNPFLGNGIVAGYDKLNNRILFTKNGNNPFTLSYSIDYKGWASFHDYHPLYYFFNNNNLYCVQTDGNLYICDSTTRKAQYLVSGTIYPSYISVVENQELRSDKIFFGADWVSEVKNSTGVLQKNLTLDTIQATSSQQDTGEVTLIPYTTYGNYNNIRKIINRWHFNLLRNNGTDFTTNRPLRDKYALIKYKYLNTPNLDSTQNSLYLYDLQTKMRKAEL